MVPYQGETYRRADLSTGRPIDGQTYFLDAQLVRKTQRSAGEAMGIAKMWCILAALKTTQQLSWPHFGKEF